MDYAWGLIEKSHLHDGAMVMDIVAKGSPIELESMLNPWDQYVKQS